MGYIKNIPHENRLRLAEQVSIQPGQVVSKTLAQNKAVSLTIFAFDKDEEISTHASHGDAMVTVLEGTGKFTVDGKEYIFGSRGNTGNASRETSCRLWTGSIQNVVNGYFSFGRIKDR